MNVLDEELGGGGPTQFMNVSRFFLPVGWSSLFFYKTSRNWPVYLLDLLYYSLLFLIYLFILFFQMLLVVPVASYEGPLGQLQSVNGAGKFYLYLVDAMICHLHGPLCPLVVYVNNVIEARFN